MQPGVLGFVFFTEVHIIEKTYELNLERHRSTCVHDSLKLFGKSYIPHLQVDELVYCDIFTVAVWISRG